MDTLTITIYTTIAAGAGALIYGLSYEIAAYLQKDEVITIAVESDKQTQGAIIHTLPSRPRKHVA